MFGWFKNKGDVADEIAEGFHLIRDMREVTSDLPRAYIDQVKMNPVLGVLRLHCHLRRLQSPPARSPVTATLVSLAFGTWENPLQDLGRFRAEYTRTLGESKYRAFEQQTFSLCQSPQRMLSLTVPLFIQGQMGVFSASRAPTQQALMMFLTALADAYPRLPYQDPAQALLREEPNCQLVVVLQAGQRPIVITCHPQAALRNWDAELEAASALILPQVAARAAEMLSQDMRDDMMAAIKDELRVWSSRLPSVGERADWTWLPTLL
jgi:hypothetical protein